MDLQALRSLGHGDCAGLAVAAGKVTHQSPTLVLFSNALLVCESLDVMLCIIGTDKFNTMTTNS